MVTAEVYRERHLELARRSLDEVQCERLRHIAEGRKRLVKRAEKLISIWQERIAFLSRIRE